MSPSSGLRREDAPGSSRARAGVELVAFGAGFVGLAWPRRRWPSLAVALLAAKVALLVRALDPLVSGRAARRGVARHPDPRHPDPE
jgi:hypothetical protein